MLDLIAIGLVLALPVCVYITLRDRRLHGEIVAEVVTKEYDDLVKKAIHERCDDLFSWNRWCVEHRVEECIGSITEKRVNALLDKGSFYDTLVENINRKQVGKN